MGLAFGIFIFTHLSLWKWLVSFVTERRLPHFERSELKDGIITNVSNDGSFNAKSSHQASNGGHFLIKSHLACYDNV